VFYIKQDLPINEQIRAKEVQIIDDEGIEGIKYLALQIEPEGEYDFRLFENHSDLYIDINEKGTRKAKIYIEN